MEEPRREVPLHSGMDSQLICNHNKVVFTGPPCSGKTTILKLLKKRGYNIIWDTAREILESDASVREIIDTEEFSDIIFMRQLEKENLVDQSDVSYLLETSLVDCLVYREFKSQSTEVLKGLNLKGRYRMVFLFQPLPFVYDGVRDSNDSLNQKRIYSLMKKVYLSLGYAIIDVPVMNIANRLDLVYNAIKGDE